MTAPTSLPMTPVVSRAAASGSSAAAGSGDSAPAFASALDSALDDALTGGGDTSGTDAGSAADTGTTTEDPSAAPVLTPALPPGLWALLAAAPALTPTPPSSDATTAAVGAVDATTGAPSTTVEGAVPVAVGPTPAGPGLPATPATTGAPASGAAPAAAQLPAAAGTAAALADLAADAGLTVVLDPAPAAVTTATPAASDAPAVAAAPVAVPLVPADAASTGSGSGERPGNPAGTPAATEPAPADGADTVVAGSGPAPLTPSAPVAETAAPTAPAADDAPVAAQVGRQLAVLRNAPDGSQTMTVVLTPESLGPVTVEVTITDGALDLTLHGATTAGRHALTDALPELRRELEGAGLTFSKLEIDTSGRDGALRDAQQQLLDQRTGQQGSSGRPGQQDARPRTWAGTPDHLGEGSAALATDQSASSGVDVRV